MFTTHDLLIPSVIGALTLVAAATAVFLWSRHLGRVRADELRAQGYRLIHALTEYSAWIDYQRELPLSARHLDELAAPEALVQARRITRQSFPDMMQHVHRLVQAHSRVIEYLWEQKLVRNSEGSGWPSAPEDRQYAQLRCAQEDMIDDMIELCRELIGDAREPWRRTGSDFAFSSSGIGMVDPASRS